MLRAQGFGLAVESCRERNSTGILQEFAWVGECV